MKKVIVLFVCLMVFGGGVLTAKKNLLTDEVIKKFEEKYAVGKFLVIQMEGIPAGAYGTGADVSISVNFDGSWKYNLLGNIVNAYLDKNEVAEIFKIDASGKSVEIRLITEKGHHIGDTEKQCLTKVKFPVNEGESFESVDSRILNYFKVYSSQSEIGKEEVKELKIGMLIAEVIKIMGEPSKKADLGDKIIYKYEDMVVTFQNGKVVNIEFK